MGDDNCYVCYCYEVSRDRIRSYMPKIKDELHELLKDGMIHHKDTPAKVRYCISRIGDITRAGTSCGTCKYKRDPSMEDIIKRELARRT